MAVALMSAYEARRVTTQRPVIDKYVSEVRKELLSMCARAHDITSAWLELAKDEVQYRAWWVGMGGCGDITLFAGQASESGGTNGTPLASSRCVPTAAADDDTFSCVLSHNMRASISQSIIGLGWL